MAHAGLKGLTLGLDRNTISRLARTALIAWVKCMKMVIDFLNSAPTTTLHLLAPSFLAPSTPKKLGCIHDSTVSSLAPVVHLDHVVRRRQLNNVTHNRSMHKADCGTDHAFLRSKLLIVPRNFFRSSSIKCSPSTNSAAMKKRLEHLAIQISSLKTIPDHPGTNGEDVCSKFRSLVMGSAVSASVFDKGSSLICFVKVPMC